MSFLNQATQQLLSCCQALLIVFAASEIRIFEEGRSLKRRSASRVTTHRKLPAVPQHSGPLFYAVDFILNERLPRLNDKVNSTEFEPRQLAKTQFAVGKTPRGVSWRKRVHFRPNLF